MLLFPLLIEQLDGNYKVETDPNSEFISFKIRIPFSFAELSKEVKSPMVNINKNKSSSDN